MTVCKSIKPHHIAGRSADDYFRPRIVRGGLPKAVQDEINQNIAIVSERRSKAANQRLLDKVSSSSSSSPSLSPSQSTLPPLGDAASPTASHSDASSPPPSPSDIRDARRSFMKSDWFADLDENSQEDMLNLVALRVQGRVTQAEWSESVRKARDSVRGTTSPLITRSHNDHHPWKLGYGF